MTISNANYKPQSKHDLSRVCTGKYEQDPHKYFKAFEPYSKKDTGSFPGYISRKKRLNPNISKLKPDSLWIAKMGYSVNSINNLPFLENIKLANEELYLLNCDYLSIIEKISSDCYDLLSNDKYIVPKTKLALLPIINNFTKGTKAEEVVHKINTTPDSRQIQQLTYFLSKQLAGYANLGEAQAILPDHKTVVSFWEYVKEIKAPPKYIMHNGTKIPLLGLMEVLAVARIINDIDVAGGTFNNIGYIIEYLDNQEMVARVVKIDPGFGFNANHASLYITILDYFKDKLYQSYEFNSGKPPQCAGESLDSSGYRFNEARNFDDHELLSNLKDIQYASTSHKAVIKWDNLLPRQKDEFLASLNHALDKLKDKNLIKFLLDREQRFAPLVYRLKHYEQFSQYLNNFINLQFNNLNKIYNLKARPTFLTLHNLVAGALNEQTPVSPRLEEKNQALEEILNTWITGSNPLARLFISNIQIESRVKAKHAILECYYLKLPYLNLSNLDIGYIPEGIMPYFGHLQRINLQNTMTNRLPNDIGQLSQLEMIDLRQNQINNFQLLYSQLKELTPNILLNDKDYPIFYTAILEPWINEVYWENEYVARKQAAAKIISCLINKTPELDLTNLNLSSLPQIKLREINSLKKIDIRNNNFKSLSQLVIFYNNPNITLIFDNSDEARLIETIIDNWISQTLISFTAESLIPLESSKLLSMKAKLGIAKNILLECFNNKKEELNLMSLDLKTLPKNLLMHYPFLKALYLGNNKFKELPEGIERLSKLVVLDISHNQIKEIPQDYSNLPNLKKIFLFGNNYIIIPPSIRLTDITLFV